MKNKILIVGFCLFLSFGAYAKTITAATLTNQKAFNVFNGALGKYAKLLNANNKTGQQGAYDYIINEIGAGVIATETTPNLLSASTGAREKLDWFKTKFLANTNNHKNIDGISDSDLGQRDKEGIKQAMVAAYNNICSAEGVKTFTKWFPKQLPALQTARKNSIKTCETNYNSAIKIFDVNIASWAIEGEKIKRDICVNNAYTIYYNAVKNVYDTGAESAAVKTKFDTCMNDPRVKNWTWTR